MGEVKKFASSRKDSFNPLIDLKRCLVTCKLKKYCSWSISCRGTMIRPLQKTLGETLVLKSICQRHANDAK